LLRSRAREGSDIPVILINTEILIEDFYTAFVGETA
jgi:hypothetical protein